MNTFLKGINFNKCYLEYKMFERLLSWNFCNRQFSKKDYEWF